MLSSGYKNKPRSNRKANEMKSQYNLFIKPICFSNRYRSIVQGNEIISGKQLQNKISAVSSLCRVPIHCSCSPF